MCAAYYGVFVLLELQISTQHMGNGCSKPEETFFPYVFVLSGSVLLKNKGASDSSLRHTIEKTPLDP